MKRNSYMVRPAAVAAVLSAAVILSACGEHDKKAVAEATAKSVAFSKNRGTEVTDATKQTATKLAKEASKAATDAVQTVKKSTEETLKVAKKELSKVVVAQAPGDAGKKLYAKCAGCHGSDGRRHALNKSALLAGQSASDLANKLKAYQAGERNVTGMGNLMKEQVAGLAKSDILALAEYISTFKTKGTE
ncbi:MAG: c-type cytochrome [Sulfurovum sp.]|nr:c-type cytochrome [Sulfurovum sp.]